MALFRLYFPAEAAVGVSRAGTAGCSQQGCARGPAEQLSCATARLAWGHRAPVTATATQGARLSPHTMLLTPTSSCSPSVQQKNLLIPLSGVIIEFQKTFRCWLYSQYI